MSQLTELLNRHILRASVFYNGRFCGDNSFNEEGKAGHLHIVREGEVVMHHAARPALRVDAPALVFYPQGMNHRLCSAPGKPPLLLCARVTVQGGELSALPKALPECIHIPLDRIKNMAGLLNVLFKESDTDYPGRQVVMDRMCDVVVVQIIRYAFENGQLTAGTLSGLTDPGLSRALEAIHTDPAHPWRLERLAEISGMSRSKFARYFHETVGTTPADYLTERRMIMAKVLLKKHKAIKAVATEVGYGSQPAFTKAFTARHGISPRTWSRSWQHAGS